MELIFDYTTSVRKALDEIDSKWEDYNGLIVCGTHTPSLEQAESTIIKLTEARKNGTPVLGICFGYQLMAIEFARYDLEMVYATSEEFGGGGFNVVKKLPELKVGLHNGESYWNNYEVIPEVEKKLKKIMNNKYTGIQYHPEYQSSQEEPHPLLVKFIEICKRG